MRIIKDQVKIILLSLVLLLPTYGVATEKPTASQKPFVLVDTNSYYSYWLATNQGLSRFANNARAAGYLISHERLDEITDEALEDVDILILAVPRTLLDEDKSAVRRFLNRGGGLLLLAGPGNAVNLDLSNLESLSRDYGLTFGTSEIFGSRTATVLASSPLSGPRSCNIVYSDNGRAFFNLQPSCESAAVIDDGRIYAAISNHQNLGSGRLVGVGDTLMFHNVYIGTNDNEAFGLNILDYLSGGCDLSVTLCKAKRKGGKVKVIAKVRNIGTSASNATNVTFFLFSTGSYVADSEDMVATLGRVNLPALNPGKSKKVKVKLNIPGWVTPGDYFVIAVADPNGDIRDSNTDNNYRASKKRITIY